MAIITHRHRCKCKYNHCLYIFYKRSIDSRMFIQRHQLNIYRHLSVETSAVVLTAFYYFSCTRCICNFPMEKHSLIVCKILILSRCMRERDGTLYSDAVGIWFYSECGTQQIIKFQKQRRISGVIGQQIKKKKRKSDKGKKRC